MSNFEQLAENIETFETDKPVSAEEAEVLYSIARQMLNTVPCTECRYCIENCPMELEIPELIKLYNKLSFSGRYYVSKAIEEKAEEKRPSACIGCRACEQVCPQMIKISEVFSDFSEKLKNN
jgi:predicted aldo/keto reductase-like oxidoreductase